MTRLISNLSKALVAIKIIIHIHDAMILISLHNGTTRHHGTMAAQMYEIVVKRF